LGGGLREAPAAPLSISLLRRSKRRGGRRWCPSSGRAGAAPGPLRRTREGGKSEGAGQTRHPPPSPPPRAAAAGVAAGAARPPALPAAPGGGERGVARRRRHHPLPFVPSSPLTCTCWASQSISTSGFEMPRMASTSAASCWYSLTRNERPAGIECSPYSDCTSACCWASSMLTKAAWSASFSGMRSGRLTSFFSERDAGASYSPVSWFRTKPASVMTLSVSSRERVLVSTMSATSESAAWARAAVPASRMRARAAKLKKGEEGAGWAADLGKKEK